MKDGSVIHFCSIPELSQRTLPWVIDNPGIIHQKGASYRISGRQLFTGSFHPIEDQLWEDRAAWDINVAPKEGTTLKDIFERRVIIKLAKQRLHAQRVFARFSPSLGHDAINIIMQYLSSKDYISLIYVCKVDIPKAKVAVESVTHIPTVSPASSPFIGKKYFGLILFVR